VNVCEKESECVREKENGHRDCVWVCVREREQNNDAGKEKEGGTERESEKE